MSQTTLVALGASAVAEASYLAAQAVPATSPVAVETTNAIGVGALVTAVCALIGQLGMAALNAWQKRYDQEMLLRHKQMEQQLIQDREEREWKARELAEDLERERASWAEKEAYFRHQIEELRAGMAVNAGRLDGAQRTLVRAGVTSETGDNDLDPPPHRILIVEDDADTARTLAALITNRNWIAGHAFTIQNALAKIAAECPAWVILDLTIGPEGNRQDASSLIPRIRRRCMSTKIAIMTGDAHRLDPLLCSLVDGAFVKDEAGREALMKAIGPDGG